MSRKNFMHQADLLFFNAIGTETTTQITGVRQPMPVGKPEPLTPVKPINTVYESKPIDLKPRPIVEKTKSVIKEEVFGKPTYVEPYSPIEPLRPEPSQPLPLIPVVSEGYPKPINTTVDTTTNPQPVIPIVNQIITETTPSSATFPSLPSYGGGTSGKPVSGGGASVEGKKSWIPLILTLGGLAIIVLKPLK